MYYFVYVADDSQKDRALQTVLAEFNALRQEIVDLGARRQTLLLYQMTTSGALFSFALSGKGRTLFLMIIPFITYLCYSRYIMMRVDVSRIAKYIEEELSPRTPDGLNWEVWHKSRHKIDLSMTPVPPTFLAFPGISALALAAALPEMLSRFGSKAVGQAIALAPIWIVGAALTLFVAHRVWTYSVLLYIRHGRWRVDEPA